MNRLLAMAVVLLATSLAPAKVRVQRVPEHGVQPQVVVRQGVVHAVYLTGDPRNADVRYIRSTDDGATWSAPIAVGSAKSGIAMGTVRGPHLAAGRDGIVHVAWMGSSHASPKAPGGGSPMLYARLLPDASAFEAQRNLITTRAGLDGGGSIAADEQGRVHVAWHAPVDKPDGPEASRRLWITTSTDDGATFAPERAVHDAPTGACACCAVQLHASGDSVFALYRGAANQTDRGMFLLTSTDRGQSFHAAELAPMKLGVCVMSTADFADAPDATLAAWETKGQVFFGKVDASAASVASAVTVGTGQNQKHPTLAIARSGDVLCAWTEETSFGKGGQLAWRTFDASGKPRDEHGHEKDAIPAHGLPAAFATADGNFVILH